MTVELLLAEPGRVDEPVEAQEFSQVLTQVASQGRPVIVRRDGADLAAVIPMALLELVREFVSRQEVEQLAAQIDWKESSSKQRPPQEWFDDQDNPFEPEENASS